MNNRFSREQKCHIFRESIGSWIILAPYQIQAGDRITAVFICIYRERLCRHSIEIWWYLFGHCNLEGFPDTWAKFSAAQNMLFMKCRSLSTPQICIHSQGSAITSWSCSSSRQRNCLPNSCCGSLHYRLIFTPFFSQRVTICLASWALVYSKREMFTLGVCLLRVTRCVWTVLRA